jgi:hypothetical protein
MDHLHMKEPCNSKKYLQDMATKFLSFTRLGKVGLCTQPRYMWSNFSQPNDILACIMHQEELYRESGGI